MSAYESLLRALEVSPEVRPGTAAALIAAHDAERNAEPLVVRRFDVAMEPAIEDQPLFTIGAVAEDGRPVALVLDPENRAKVAGWLGAGAELTVYRASHESIVMGLYTTATEARAHCVAAERRAWAKGSALVFDWIEDEEDGVAELVTVAESGETEHVTGYVVTALTVASAYDEEADE